MSLFGPAVLVLVALVAFAVAFVVARGVVVRLDRFRDVIGGPATPLPAVDGTADGHFVAAVGDIRHGRSDATMALVTDTVGYWCLRHWAEGARSNAFTFLGRLLFRLRYGDVGWRLDDDRRRAGLLLPAPLPVRSGGEETMLALGPDGHPLQRLEADGMLVPFLVGAGPLVVLFLSVLAPITVLVFLPDVVPAPVVPLGALAPLVGYLLALGVLKVSHDTAIVGRWESVMPPEADEVPPAAADAAAGTEDPAGTALVAVRSIERGDRLRLLGRVEPTEEGVELVDGIVTTRSRHFLALAAFVGVLQYLTAAVFAAAVGAAATWGVYAAL